MNVDPARPFRHLCVEADERDAMSDGEFWQHIADQQRGPLHDEPLDDSVPLVLEPACDVCGSTTACGFDELGRPWLHVSGEVLGS